MIRRGEGHPSPSQSLVSEPSISLGGQRYRTSSTYLHDSLGRLSDASVQSPHISQPSSPRDYSPDRTLGHHSDHDLPEDTLISDLAAITRRLSTSTATNESIELPPPPPPVTSRSQSGHGGAKERGSDPATNVLEEISSHLNVSSRSSLQPSASVPPTSRGSLTSTPPSKQFSSPAAAKIDNNPSPPLTRIISPHSSPQQPARLLEESEFITAGLESKLKEETLSTHRLRCEVTHLESSNQLLQQQVMEMKLRLIANETHHAELMKRCEGLEQVNEETWKKCVALGRAEEMIRIENEILKKQNTSLQLEVQESLRSAEEVKRIKESLKGEVKYYFNELQEREREEKRREERRELVREEEMNALRSEKKTLERFLAEFEKKLKRAESVVEEAVYEKEEQRKKFVEVQCVAQELSDQLRAQEKEWKRGEQEMRSLVEMKDRLLLEMKREKERLQSDLTNEMKRSLNLGKEFDQEVMRRERLSAEMERSENELKKIRQENEELRGEVVKHKEVISFINRLSVGNVTTEELMRVGVNGGDTGGRKV